MEQLKYIRGDVVKIQLQEKWVEGFIDKCNAKDKSYSVTIQDYAAYNINEQLHDVKEDNIQPLFLTKDVEFLLAEGYNREEVFQSLDAANGDLDDALLYLHRHDRSEGISEQESCSLQRSSEMSSNSTSQPSSGGHPSSSSIKEFTPSAKQLEAEASRSSNSLQVHSISAAYRKTSFCDDVREKKKITMRPREDEFDYTIVFQTIPLGFEIHPCANNKNACVGNTLNEFSQENVYKGSLILDCNDVWLLGQSTVYIQQCIKAEAQTLPISITFRAKKWMTSERARNLRLRLEKSRTKKAKSLSFVKPRKKVNMHKVHERSKTENYLSPSSCTMTSQHTRKVVRVRLPPSQRRKRMKKVSLNPELRLLIIGGKTEFGITHVTASIKNLETLTTKKYNPTRTPCFGENLTWEKFKQEAVSSLSIKAMSQDKVVGIGKISIPILPCTINHSVELTSTTGLTVGNLSVKVTHIR